MSFISNISNFKRVLTASGVIFGSSIGLYHALKSSVSASDLELHVPNYPWSHNGFLKSLDHQSIRRGFEVYKQVCAACHGLKYVAYRELVGVSHTKEEAAEEAAQIQVEDGPNDNGKMFMRPGKLYDYFQTPYPNEESAKKANNGAIPPDLTLIVLGRHGNEDYIFSLLTGFCDAPAGVTTPDGTYFNPYFPGGALSMAAPLSDGAIEYSDGTKATRSQMAKDVVTFLSWAAQPEHDVRKKMSIDGLLILLPLALMLWLWKQNMWSSLKSRKIIFNTKQKPKTKT